MAHVRDLCADNMFDRVDAIKRYVENNYSCEIIITGPEVFGLMNALQKAFPTHIHFLGRLLEDTDSKPVSHQIAKALREKELIIIDGEVIFESINSLFNAFHSDGGKIIRVHNVRPEKKR